tara:strand:- start:185 stop:1012 length:828 start_codon:yes stop_codon:yes gene_type:complete
MVNIIAEIGINHNGNLDTCIDMIKSAKECGADYVKFQKRDPDVCVPELQKNQPKATPWGEMSYLEYKYRIEFDQKEYNIINEECKHLNIGWFVSVWDEISLRFMVENYDSELTKIPSAKATNLELIKKAKDIYRNIIVSTGMTTKQEIDNITKIFRNTVDRNKLILMHTVSSYPTNLKDLRMDTIDYLRSSYPYSVGYSSHEQNTITAAASVYKGVNWIERHFTTDKSMWGTDQKSSSNPTEMKVLVDTIRMLEGTLGVREGVLDCEKDNLRKMR